MNSKPPASTKKNRRARHRAREIALMFLYQWDLLSLRGIEPEMSARDFCNSQDKGLGAAEFAMRLIEGVSAHRAELDAAIHATAKNWSLERMSVVDRTILRIGAFELLHCADIPAKVSINEAIELAKSYSTTRSGAFVNGILDRIAASQGNASASQGG